MKAGTGIVADLGLMDRRTDTKAYQAEWRRRNREKFNEYSTRYHHEVIKPDDRKRTAKNLSGSFGRRKRKYGITRAEFITKLTEQNSECMICHDKLEKLSEVNTDHDHLTGKLRDLLCGKCNHGLGNFRDDPVLLTSAIKYLERHRDEIKE